MLKIYTIDSYDDIRSSLSDTKTHMVMVKNLDANVYREYQAQFLYNPMDAGLKSKNGRGHIKIFDNGNIDVFCENGSGVNINNEGKTISLYTQTINNISPVINILTKPGGLIWNNHQINPRLYQLCGKKNIHKIPWNFYDDMHMSVNVRYWHPGNEKVSPHWDRKSINIKPFTPIRDDNEYKKLLSDLDIPI